MSQDRDEMLRSYISRVMEVRERREGAMRAAELHAIARDIGLSDADLAAAQQEARDHVTRGRQFMQHGRLDDAIEQLRKAVTLSPEDLDARLDLAQALRDRFAKGRDTQDRTRAIEQARQCIEQDPECQRAYLILNELDSPAAARSSPILFVAMAAGMVGLLAIGGFVGYLTWVSAPEPVIVSTPPALNTPTTKAPPPSIPSPPIVATPQQGESTIPFELALPDGAPLRAATIKSQYDYYAISDTGYYKLQVDLINTSPDKSISAMDGTLTLFDADDKPLISDSHPPMSATFSPPLLPGDALGLARIKELKQAPARATFTVKSVKTTLLPADTGKLAPLSWQTPSPFKDRITITERTASFKRYDKNREGYFTLLIAASLSGDTPVEKMKLRIELLDAAGAVAKQASLYLPGLGGGPLQPGTTRPAKYTLSSEQDVASYRLIVEEIE
jgi:tetratricopeptide (TPR) repeat protein